MTVAAERAATGTTVRLVASEAPRPLSGAGVPWRLPAWWMTVALMLGGLVAIGVAGHANMWAAAALVRVASPEAAAHLNALQAPTVEEPAKLLGVLTLVLLARRGLSGALDGLVYGALIGLGFQELENVHYALAEASRSDRPSLVAFGYFVVRGVLAGWATHVAWTAVAGAGLGWAVRHRDRPWPVRVGVAAAALGGSWALHAVWNSPFGMGGGVGGGADGLLRLAILNLLGLIPVALVTWLALRGEARRYPRALVPLADPAVAVGAEIAALGSPVRRFRIRWAAYVHGGWAAARAVRRLHRAQAALARFLTTPDGEHGHPDNPNEQGNPGEPGDPGDRELAELRADVLAARERIGAAMRAAAQARVPVPAVAHPGEGLRGATVGGGVALGIGLVGPVGLWVGLPLELVAETPAIAVTAGGLAGLGGGALVLADRAVREARRSGTAADVRYGVAALLGVVSLVLAAAFAGQLLLVLVSR